MLQTLALAAALSLAPAQNAPLAITNDQIRHGFEFGPIRPNNKLLPGDMFYLTFDIENLKRDAEGTVKFSVRMDGVTDGVGKTILAPQAVTAEQVLPLGGDKLPSRVWFIIPLNQGKGAYKCGVTVTDLVTKASKSIERPFEVLPPRFGIVKVLATIDSDGGIPTPLRGTEGQPFFLTFYVVGFARHAQTKQPNTVAELRVFDQNGKPANEKPNVIAYEKGVLDNIEALPFLYPIPMNQAGSYTVEVKTVCKISGQTDSFKFPLKVHPVDK